MFNFELWGIAGSHVAVILITSICIYFFRQIAIAIQNYRIKKKYPIANSYISTYEDEVDGKKIFKSELTVLKQIGRRITGTACSLQTNRVWNLEGKITTKGQLYGVYLPESPYDGGVGNFFLVIKTDGYMEGVWSGYDATNKAIKSGLYMHTPIMEAEIGNVHATEIPAVADIADRELGKDYLPIALLKDYIQNPNKYICKGAYIDGDLVGFCLSVICDKASLGSFVWDADIPKKFELCHQLAIIKTIAVKPEYKGRGIGSSLVGQSIKALRQDHGIRAFCSVGWQNGGKVNIKGVLEQFKFIEFKIIQKYWEQDSIAHNYTCPACGFPCQCSAVLYTKYF